MHISEGVLSAPVLISGAALAAAGTAIGLKRLDYDRIAQVGVLSSAFFVASLIHVNVGPASVHLILNGIVGLLLGWSAVPAILVALTLQAIFFQYGGITVLGINTLIMALPALACHYLFRGLLWRRPSVAATASFACGFLAVFLSALLLGSALYFTEKEFMAVAALAVGANLPVMVVEGVITIFCIAFLKKVDPGLLPGKRPAENRQAPPAPDREEVADAS
ncbi:MAG: cobalt transporter CbiM [Desulfosarcinaceae bacterium]|nr:cobalt transporter CbiM [Desulfosarcinaceae bacterium]